MRKAMREFKEGEGEQNLVYLMGRLIMAYKDELLVPGMTRSWEEGFREGFRRGWDQAFEKEWEKRVRKARKGGFLKETDESALKGMKEIFRNAREENFQKEMEESLRRYQGKQSWYKQLYRK